MSEKCFCGAWLLPDGRCSAEEAMWQRLNSQAFREAMHRKFDVDLFDGKPDREARR